MVYIETKEKLKHLREYPSPKKVLMSSNHDSQQINPWKDNNIFLDLYMWIAIRKKKKLMHKNWDEEIK